MKQGQWLEAYPSQRHMQCYRAEQRIFSVELLPNVGRIFYGTGRQLLLD